MACAVLAPMRGRILMRGWMLFAALAGAAAVAQGQAVACPAENAASLPADVQAQVQQMQQTVEAGPFYRKLVQRYGKPEKCTARVDGTSVALAYAFAHEARLVEKTDSAIEYSEQWVEFRGLDRAAALALLKQGAAEAFGEQGCGLDWSRAARETVKGQLGSRAEVYTGTSCNCKAKVYFQGKAVAGLMVSGSC